MKKLAIALLASSVLAGCGMAPGSPSMTAAKGSVEASSLSLDGVLTKAEGEAKQGNHKAALADYATAQKIIDKSAASFEKELALGHSAASCLVYVINDADTFSQYYHVAMGNDGYFAAYQHADKMAKCVTYLESVEDIMFQLADKTHTGAKPTESRYFYFFEDLEWLAAELQDHAYTDDDYKQGREELLKIIAKAEKNPAMVKAGIPQSLKYYANGLIQ